MCSTNVVCYWFRNWGDGWGPTYVKRLYSALKRNTTLPFNFYCFTDKPDKIFAEFSELCTQVQIIYFEPQFKWNLCKFQCFEYPLQGKVITIDLDTIITSNLDHILNFTENFITCSGAYQTDKAGGSLVGTNAEYGEKLLRYIKENKKYVERNTSGSERYFIRKFVPKHSFWQNNYPGIYSYKVDCKKSLPNDAWIVRFHGSPRIHQVMDEPLVQKYWI